MFVMRFTERAYFNYTEDDVKNSPGGAHRVELIGSSRWALGISSMTSRRDSRLRVSRISAPRWAGFLYLRHHQSGHAGQLGLGPPLGILPGFSLTPCALEDRLSRLCKSTSIQNGWNKC